MTKAEIYFEVHKKWRGGIYPAMAEDKMYQAMDEFAKQEAIEFGEYLKRHFIPTVVSDEHGIMWYKTYTASMYNEQPQETKYFTTEQVYELYLQSKKQ